MSSPGRRNQKAAILAIGDEVLRGEVNNTNAAFLSERLFDLGFDVREHQVISDEPADIRGALVRLRADTDVIVACGGLGPTEDDRTVEVVAELLGVSTTAHQASLEAMKKRFDTHGFELTPNNLRQVRVPDGAEALTNAAGIAPGFSVRLGASLAFFLPGVPRELEKMFVDQVTPRLAQRMAEHGWPRPAVRTWHIYGMGESHVDHRLAGLLNGVEGGTLHFRTASPENHVKIVVRDADEQRAHERLEQIDAELRKRIGPGIYGIDDESFAAAVGRSMVQQQATLALAESCTGGLAGELVTSVPGASNYFRGAVVAYSNEIKLGVLGVKEETLRDFGAVSEPCAREMADGAKRVLGSTVAVAVTGVAGPEGGAPDKPVGTVCFAVSGPTTTRTATKLFPGDRDRVRRAAAFFALDMARRYFDTRKR